MAEKKNLLTREGLRKLEDELQDLKVNRRQEIAQKIKNQEMQLVIVNGKNNMNYQKKQPLVANLPVLLARVQGRVVRVAQGVA